MQVFQIWKTSGTTYLFVVWTSWKSSNKVVWTSCKVVWKSSELPGSRLDFLKVVWTSWKSSDKEVVWTSRKSSGLHGSLLTKSPFHNRSERFVVWKSSGLLGSLLTKSYGLPVKSSRLPVKSSGLPVKSSGSRLDFLFFRSGFNMQVFQIWKTYGTTYLLVVWKSSESRLEVVWTSWKSFDKVVWTSCKVVWTSCKVVWTSCKVVWKSSELPKSRVVLSTQVESKLVFVEE
ncbi:hypothetical protein DY000_02050913 [Brassica cretica]|uniref:Uncharacterized protein n=1 Tax=Brassica cretica TaxID=69181 RepID=A0ABQ7EW07_BRACR|nr:hypothetical protein DY000_02050913 [Brassica cretica]